MGHLVQIKNHLTAKIDRMMWSFVLNSPQTQNCQTVASCWYKKLDRGLDCSVIGAIFIQLEYSMKGRAHTAEMDLAAYAYKWYTIFKLTLKWKNYASRNPNFNFYFNYSFRFVSKSLTLLFI